MLPIITLAERHINQRRMCLFLNECFACFMSLICLIKFIISLARVCTGIGTIMVPRSLTGQELLEDKQI